MKDKYEKPESLNEEDFDDDFEDWSEQIDEEEQSAFEDFRTANEPYQHLRESDDRLERIQWFLFEYGSGRSIREASGVHGFISAVVCAPRTIPPSEWMREIWGKDLVWKSEEDSREFTQLLNDVHSDIADTLTRGDFLPPIHVDIWVEGFLSGAFLWNFEEKDQEYIEDDLLLISMSTSEVKFEELEDISELQESIAGSVLAIFDHFHSERR